MAKAMLQLANAKPDINNCLLLLFLFLLVPRSSRHGRLVPVTLRSQLIIWAMFGIHSQVIRHCSFMPFKPLPAHHPTVVVHHPFCGEYHKVILPSQNCQIDYCWNIACKTAILLFYLNYRSSVNLSMFWLMAKRTLFGYPASHPPCTINEIRNGNKWKNGLTAIFHL